MDHCSCSLCLYPYFIFYNNFLFQISDILVQKLNQNAIQFDLKPGVRILVHAAHLTAGWYRFLKTSASVVSTAYYEFSSGSTVEMSIFFGICNTLYFYCKILKIAQSTLYACLLGTSGRSLIVFNRAYCYQVCLGLQSVCVTNLGMAISLSLLWPLKSTL